MAHIIRGNDEDDFLADDAASEQEFRDMLDEDIDVELPPVLRASVDRYKERLASGAPIGDNLWTLMVDMTNARIAQERT